MLTAYQTQLQALIQAPNSPASLVPTATQTVYINAARNQVATEAECVANFATLAVTGAAQQYPFSAIVLAAGTVGVAGVMNVRKATWSLPAGGGGQGRMYGREWEWFLNYVLAQSAAIAGLPKYWAQYGQGASGTLWVNLPSGPFTLNLDTACYPIPLVNDTTPEAIPYQWTDAVPFYAAWLAMQSLQRQPDAETMLRRYEVLMQRARASATPSVLPTEYRQGPDPFIAGRLGAQQQPRGGGG